MRKAFSGSRPRTEYKTQQKGFIKQWQVIVLLAGWTRADKRTNLERHLWQMTEFQCNLNTKVPCKEFWLPVPDYDQKNLSELRTAASNEVSGGFQKSQANCLYLLNTNCILILCMAVSSCLWGICL